MAVPDDDKPVQNPLTLVMKIKSKEDAHELHKLLDDIQGRPPTENPITAALTKIGTVHFARFVFLDHDDKLAVITAYDHSFDDYINEFVTQIGQVFDMLLAHMADAPPLPVREHRKEFLQYVKDNDMPPVGTFYSAYPSLTVLDILDLASRED